MAKDILPPRSTPELGFPETSLGGYLPASRQAKAEEPRIVPPASMIAFEDALDRLEETIDRETATLEAHHSADLDEINRRKSHSLLELTRMTRTLPATADQRLRRRLDRCRREPGIEPWPHRRLLSRSARQESLKGRAHDRAASR